MNAPHAPSPLASVPMAPADPILGVTEAYVADASPRKVNLGVGVYTDDQGKIPLLECVRHAESERLKSASPRGYLPIDGLAAYDRAVQTLVFGKESDRIVTVQALGGTGGLKVGADFLRSIAGESGVWISDPMGFKGIIDTVHGGALALKVARVEVGALLMAGLSRFVEDVINPWIDGLGHILTDKSDPHLMVLHQVLDNRTKLGRIVLMAKDQMLLHGSP